MLKLPKRVLAAAILGTTSTRTASLFFVSRSTSSSIFRSSSRTAIPHQTALEFHHQHLSVSIQRGSRLLQNPSTSFASIILSQPACSSQTLRAMSTGGNDDGSIEEGGSVLSVPPIVANLQHVRDRIRSTCQRCGVSESRVRLVAVSKTKPVSYLRHAYDAGQRAFGENYVQELVDKVPQLPDDVVWHFIGPLQSNKAGKILQAFDGPQVHRLVVETVASEKLASKLNHAVATSTASTSSNPQRLKVMVQVNTSGEDSKSGVEPSDVVALCRFILEQCPNLQLVGVMTIGAEGDASCFDALVVCRDQVVTELNLQELEVSMGMSGDFEAAIERGATSVRVGSTIFGERDYSKK